MSRASILPSVPHGPSFLVWEFTRIACSKVRLPAGEVGELVLSGVQVAAGYLNRPDLTAERFLPCPWDKSGAGRMYRTGDLARLNPSTGLLEYLGRADRQVRLGGVRIELGEVESVVLGLYCGRLAGVAVVCIDKALVGVTLARAGDRAPNGPQMVAKMASVLPRAYIPTEWHDLKGTTHFPLSANGKTDVYAIEAWVRSTRAISTWSEIYDQAYDDDSVTAAEGADPLMDWAGYKDSFAPGKLHVPATISDWVMATVEEAAAYASTFAGGAGEVCVALGASQP